MKMGPIIAVACIAGALGFGAYSFKGSLVAYVPFAQAIAAAPTGSTVQIMGSLVAGDTRFDHATRSLDFVLKEQATGQLMPVSFKSPKPDNFDHALRVTAIGHYDVAQKRFFADNLLVKCPSKYAGDSSGPQDRSYAGQG